MRAIDADALREQFPEPEDWCDPERALVHITGIWAEIDDAPTIEPERKKGKWNTYYHSDIDFSHSCNQCGYSAPYQMIGGKVFQKKWNFCPNCGADMMEDNDD